MSSGSACWILWLTPMDWLALSIGRSGSQPLEYSLADVVNYCIVMADRLQVDLEEIVLKKLEKNRQKYPVEKAKGNSKKYNEL